MNQKLRKSAKVKNPDSECPLADFISDKYTISNKAQISVKSLADILVRQADKTADFTAKIIDSHEVEELEQPDRIGEALNNIKEQMLVRDYNRREYFLRNLELIEDEEQFGFIEQYIKNRLTKFSLDISFESTGKLIRDYFKHKLSVPDTNISQFCKDEE